MTTYTIGRLRDALLATLFAGMAYFGAVGLAVCLAQGL